MIPPLAGTYLFLACEGRLEGSAQRGRSWAVLMGGTHC
jgi:hypothetical protein